MPEFDHDLTCDILSFLSSASVSLQHALLTPSPKRQPLHMEGLLCPLPALLVLHQVSLLPRSLRGPSCQMPPAAGSFSQRVSG